MEMLKMELHFNEIMYCICINYLCYVRCRLCVLLPIPRYCCTKKKSVRNFQILTLHCYCTMKLNCGAGKFYFIANYEIRKFKNRVAFFMRGKRASISRGRLEKQVNKIFSQRINELNESGKKYISLFLHRLQVRRNTISFIH